MRGYRFHTLSKAILFFVVLLSGSGCATVEYEVLESGQLSEFYSKGVFLLESVSLNSCLRADPSGLSMASCDRPTAALLWKWVSRHRLFNLGTSLCLGINVSSLHQPEVGIFKCPTSLQAMWWRCSASMLYGSLHNKLAVVASKVVVRRRSMHQWRIYGGTGEAPCAYPYEEIHTLLGNAHGMPCAMPFLYNTQWYWECTSEGREDQHLWCSTTSLYDQDQRWGFCPTSVSGCDSFWESSADLKACYQFNLNSLLTWSQAYTSCQSQGGDLLSITHVAEHSYIRERLSDIGVVVWIGLNHLAKAEGWQWSDRSPLSLVQYTSDIASTAVQQGQLCGVFDATREWGHWRSLACESAVPYICKKTPNISRRAEPLDNWQYKDTVCPDGWLDHNDFCYHYLEEKASWENSSSTCKSLGGELTSIRSLAELQLLLRFLNGSEPKVWIGLYVEAEHPAVQWSDGSPVTFTSWYSQEPTRRHKDSRACVTANRKNGNWEFEECEKLHPAVCRTSGLVIQHPAGELDIGCPEGWKRMGQSCYKIADEDQTFEDAVRGYTCKGPLVTIEDRFEQAFLNSLIDTYNRSTSQLYWIALQDQNRTGEYRWLTQNSSTAPLTYSNWNQHQPVTGGGCVVMVGHWPLGHWEVKNCTSHKALAICEQDVSSFHMALIPAPHLDPLVPCKEGWDSRPGLPHCYKVFHSEKILMSRSWSEAEFFCRALGADLASFHHYKEQSFIKQLLTNMFHSTAGRWFWVGFSRRDPKSAGAWAWSDGTPVKRERDGWMEGWMDASQLDEQMDGCMDELINGWMLRQFSGTGNRNMNRCIDSLKILNAVIGLSSFPWVATSFIEDKNEDVSTHECAAYSGLNNALSPRSCEAKHEWICKVPRGAEITKPYWYNNQSEPWVFYRGAEYFLGSQPFPWESVLFACKMMGADLLTLHSKEEAGFIKGHMMKVPRASTEWWLGLSAGSGHYGYSWTDGSALDYEKWKNGRPLKATGQKCVYMSSLSGEWSTGRCAEPRAYACKRRTVSVLEVLREPKFIGACPPKWFYFGYKCLLLHLPAQQEEGKTWVEARSICANLHGTLVSIENGIEQAYVTMLLDGFSPGVWIGLRDTNATKWVSGKSVTYTNWSPVEPKSSSTEEEWLNTASVGAEPLCTVLSSNHNFHLVGAWYNEKCTQVGYGFVCQKPQDVTKRPSHSNRDTAYLDSEYRNRSYHVVRGNLSWSEALRSCMEKHMDLVSISDPFHQAYLTVLVNRLAAPHWIGFFSEDDGINYHWTDGSDTVFTHWNLADDEEDEGFVLGDCVYMDVTGGWNRADCDMQLSGALCYAPRLKRVAFSYEVVCKETWLKFRGSCYSFESVILKLPLEEAREYCRKKENSSDVLTIRDEAENRFFLEQLKDFYDGFQTVWLGIYYDIDRDALSWMDGSVLDYTNWRWKVPEKSVMKADTCVSARVSDGEWLLANCRDRLGFVCKTRSEVDPEVEVKALNSLHHGIVPAAVLVAILFFAVLAGLLWFVYKRNTLGFRRLPSLGNAYYRQSSSQATDSDGNVLLTDLETQPGDE
ncbi:secretory phospholipase A2 receptor isoform X1 [Electrophorus electricus]|uniref:secretory phospholipase A2 receptor isoform X1 n=1 Tax=Electrophorus electricus TaxID=8005 RepID=UPI0015CFC23C|nr:secretory phospholipase A2 receptor isoform X1 [Electrophorus electricus]